MPQFVPPQMQSAISQLKELKLPFAFLPNTATAAPPSTQTVALIDAPSVTPIIIPSTATATLLPTRTLQPTAQFTPTPDNTAIPAATSLGGGTGQIVFASTRSGLPQLYLVKTDGTDLVQITNMEQGACQPSWSPDGKQLVFISPCLGRADLFETLYNESSLYIINADGSGLKQLTPSPGSDFEPAWSPDGKRIAFTSVREGFRQIYLLDLSTSSISLITNTTNAIESSQPAWSPDGKKIAYTVKRVGAYQVWAMNDDGQEAVQLARSGQNYWDFLPAWSPDGKTIYFSQRQSGAFRPWLMKIDYENPSQDAKRMNFTTPVEDVSFSPDGLWLVYEGMASDGNRDIYFITVAGSGRTRLTNDPKIDFDPAWRPVQRP
jgi:Tol biopolymer transport system component